MVILNFYPLNTIFIQIERYIRIRAIKVVVYLIQKTNKMENKKMSLAELKAKANAVNTAEALNAIKGGVATVCHDGKCDLLSAPTPTGTRF
jgi:hypothetical protein